MLSKLTLSGNSQIPAARMPRGESFLTPTHLRSAPGTVLATGQLSVKLTLPPLQATTVLLSTRILKWYEEEFSLEQCVYFKHSSLETRYSVLTLGMSNSVRLKLEASDRVIRA